MVLLVITNFCTSTYVLEKQPNESGPSLRNSFVIFVRLLYAHLWHIYLQYLVEILQSGLVDAWFAA